ncbi:MAG: hypothetical protein ACTSQ7_00040 [Alphaproteobacteria bacterium]
MKLRERADRVANSIFSALQTSPDADLTKKVTDVIEKAIIDVVLEERQRCANVAVAHGTPEADLASKIAEDIRRAKDAEIAGRAASLW